MMGLIYRIEKGYALTMEEVDGNFRDLDERLQKLEKKPSYPPFHFFQEGERVFVKEETGTIWGQFTLPKVFFTPRGKWCPNTHYFCFDLVSFPGQIFCCLQNHLGGDSFKKDLEASQWSLFLDLIPLLKKKT